MLLLRNRKSKETTTFCFKRISNIKERKNNMKKNKKKILVISQYFYPEQFRINDICKEWIARGYNVTVLTGIPNYPQGKFYKGYGLRKNRIEIWNGIKIIRIPLIPRGRTKIGLILNYLSFPISGYFWAKLTKEKADIIFMFETSPMTQCKIGVHYAKRIKVPLLLYVQDLWPENVEIITGISSPVIIKPIERMVRKIYHSCTHIFTTSQSFVNDVLKLYDNKEKVSFWPQYAEDFYQKYNGSFNMKDLKDDNFKIIFTGNIGQAQGLDILPKVAEKLKGEKVKFVIVGDGRYKKELISEISSRNVEDKFLLIDKRPPEEIPQLLATCDMAFISFMNSPLWKKTIPAKLQSYMACGMPILAAAEGEVEQIINKSECGYCCNVGDVNGLYEIIVKAMESEHSVFAKQSENAIQYYKENFDKKKLMDEMDNYIGSLINENINDK